MYAHGVKLRGNFSYITFGCAWSSFLKLCVGAGLCACPWRDVTWIRVMHPVWLRVAFISKTLRRGRPLRLPMA
ncbi:MAG: hypothetical protein RLZ42_1229 [Armatimonadota bacterium]